MPLSPPPDNSDELKDFPPLKPPLGPHLTIYRIFRNRDPDKGYSRDPFYFSSENPLKRGGRYDLPKPLGACYFSNSKVGAWLEVFQQVKKIAKDDLRTRRMCITSSPSDVPTADLLSKKAKKFGITAEINTIDDYQLPRAWAAKLFEAGFRALWGQIRHDPTLKERSVTLLDDTGAHQPFMPNWTYEARRMDDDDEFLSDVRSFGYDVSEIPYDVVIDSPTM